MKKLGILLATLCIVTSCLNEGQPVNTDSVKDGNGKDPFRVEKLFSIDSCTIYRFYDMGGTKYFMTGPGKMIDAYPEGDGQ